VRRHELKPEPGSNETQAHPGRGGFAEWRKDPEHVRAYEALEEEFAVAEVLINARASTKLTQQELAERMSTTQATIARLESGKQMPTTRTLKRIADATGTKLRISFEPEECRA
jgi:ribosome-binding protein aMBF1 (putative translation factor)